MRAEIGAANTQAEEAAAKVKQLETEDIRKGHEQKSLALRVKSLQEQLDEKQSQHQQMTEKYVIFGLMVWDIDVCTYG